jgi:hypothetical protein
MKSITFSQRLLPLDENTASTILTAQLIRPAWEVGIAMREIGGSMVFTDDQVASEALIIPIPPITGLMILMNGTRGTNTPIAESRCIGILSPGQEPGGRVMQAVRSDR